VLRHAEPILHPDLLVGLETGDDAAVWRLSEARALIATVDFFTPIVDDAATWGAISATNSVSDVYAMGGMPLFALNVAAWPRDTLPLDVLGDVLEGARHQAAAGGWLVVGGHTVDGPEPMFGQVVIGEAHPDELLTNAGAQPGDVLVLTKPLGTGVIATAVKRLPPGDARLARAYPEAVRSMTTLNAVASAAARRARVHACTDVTGFGLAGHLHKMLLASGCAAEIDLAALPLLPDVGALIADGFVPGGTGRNLEFVSDHLEGGTTAARQLFADPQTSGGLLVAVEPAQLDGLVAELRTGAHEPAVIGRVTRGPAGAIALV
jgi:selenide,water dikinase